jgi:hypothetical protein
VALFTAVLLAGVLLFEAIGFPVRDEAWLVGAVIAAVLLFCIPESGKARDPKKLIFNLVAVIGVYGIFLKCRPWLADLIGPRFATAVSVLFIVAFAGVLLMLPAVRRPKARTHDAQ